MALQMHYLIRGQFHQMILFSTVACVLYLQRTMTFFKQLYIFVTYLNSKNISANYSIFICRIMYFVQLLILSYKQIGPSLVIYPRPIRERFSLSHDKISKSPPSFSCYLN